MDKSWKIGIIILNGLLVFESQIRYINVMFFSVHGPPSVLLSSSLVEEELSRRTVLGRGRRGGRMKEISIN